jgi:hypothetical protein
MKLFYGLFDQIKAAYFFENSRWAMAHPLGPPIGLLDFGLREYTI